MTDNGPVNPGELETAIIVATDEIDGIHYPIYKAGFGPADSITQVNEDNPLPVSAVVVETPPLTYNTDTVTVLNEISRKLSILIKYESLLHKVDLSEEELL